MSEETMSDRKLEHEVVIVYEGKVYVEGDRLPVVEGRLEPSDVKVYPGYIAAVFGVPRAELTPDMLDAEWKAEREDALAAYKDAHGGRVGSPRIQFRWRRIRHGGHELDCAAGRYGYHVSLTIASGVYRHNPESASWAKGWRAFGKAIREGAAREAVEKAERAKRNAVRNAAYEREQTAARARLVAKVNEGTPLAALRWAVDCILATGGHDADDERLPLVLARLREAENRNVTTKDIEPNRWTLRAWCDGAGS